MKKIFYILVATLVLISCHGAKKAMQKGQYDVAINKAVVKLQKKPNDPEHLQVLELSFLKVVEQDNRKIEFLKKEGRPDNWDNINAVYIKMNNRQEKVSKLMNIPHGIEFKNYSPDIIASKERAAEYYYVHAEQLLKNNNKKDARIAYDELKRVKGYYNSYRDLDQLLVQAKELGTSNVLFEMKNATGIPLPPEFEKDLMKISLSTLNKNWIRYFNEKQGDLIFDYTILINMKVITVSPESEKQLFYEEKKKVRDGWEYELDEDGNVKKDTLGNDIKVPKYKTITCKVVEKLQSKSAVIIGSINYIDNRTNELIRTDPIKSETFWQHRSGIANGNVNALTAKTKKIIGIPPAPFPRDFDMLSDAGQILKRMTKDIIYQNKNVLY
ncbi:MAG: hypothetical protein HOK72_12795 [Flavobacteriales bacterium]|jgi:hypothetical protein|nr:hypothetical protein [Flavobacteriales bacterium]